VRIYKYVLALIHKQTKYIPRGATVLSVQPQDGGICLWMKIDPEETIKVSRTFVLHSTGEEVRENLEYIGTVQLRAGVWHVFELQGVVSITRKENHARS